MNIRLLHQLPPTEGNPRNSEGAFIRNQQGDILFAYSRYNGTSIHDNASCDIALIVSKDEGETWGEPRIIAYAKDFGTENIMSVSAMEQRDGSIGFYFLIKENDFSTTIGRAISRDGVNFHAERCIANFPKAYYVINNDRLVRLTDGRIVAPASWISVEQNEQYSSVLHKRFTSTATCLISDDDGKSFYKASFDLTTTDKVNTNYGLQEPGIIQRADGSLYFWMRTAYGRQYEAESSGDIHDIDGLQPSQFTSPISPMQMKAFDDVTYTIYNPIPSYNGMISAPGTRDRILLVIRKSTDDGHSFGELNVIESDPTRGYCYTAIFKTNDEHLLIGYCRGDAADGNTLCRTGIAKIEIDSIK